MSPGPGCRPTRTNRRTVYPSAASVSASAEPMRPLAPLMATLGVGLGFGLIACLCTQLYYPAGPAPSCLMTDVPVSADPGETNTQPHSVDAGKYVYCIIRSDRHHDFGAIGIGGGGRVVTIAYNDLAAVVVDTPIVVYDPTCENV